MTRLLPPTPGLRLAFAVALPFLAASLGFLAGTVAAESDHPGERSVDVGFLRDMITHHEQALEMSNIELQIGVDESMRGFAREILLTQSYEIGAMERQLEQWGYARHDRPDEAMTWMGAPTPATEMPGLASAEQMEKLRGLAGRDVDELFAPLMQEHHRGGVHMASFAESHASDRFVRELAARMARNQRTEIRELEQARLRTQAR